MTKERRSFLADLYAAEFNATFSVEGAIQRYKMICRKFSDNPCNEVLVISEASARVLHDKYGLSYPEIEEIEISAIC